MKPSMLRRRVGIKADRLRHRIKVYKLEEGRSPTTGAILPEALVLKHTLWASIEPLSVKDVLTAQAAGSETSVRCVLRYRDDIDSTMQIEHRGKWYTIDGDPLPDADSGLEYITLMLKSVKE